MGDFSLAVSSLISHVQSSGEYEGAIFQRHMRVKTKLRREEGGKGGVDVRRQ